MDLVTLILMCSLGTTPSTNTLVYQIARTNDADPTYIDDWTDGVVYSPNTLEEGRAMISALVTAGHQIRVGVMQVPARQTIQSYSMSAEDLVDSCQNIAVGSDRIEQAIQKYPQSKQDALAWYISGEPKDPIGQSWAYAVLKVEAVDLEEKSGDIENPLPSRQYAQPKMRLFDSAKIKKDDDQEKKITQTLFPIEESKKKIPRPEKWNRNNPKQSAVTQSKSKKQKSKNSGPKKAQEPVTDERLETKRAIQMDNPGGNE